MSLLQKKLTSRLSGLDIVQAVGRDSWAGVGTKKFLEIKFENFDKFFDREEPEYINFGPIPEH